RTISRGENPLWYRPRSRGREAQDDDGEVSNTRPRLPAESALSEKAIVSREPRSRSVARPALLVHSAISARQSSMPGATSTHLFRVCSAFARSRCLSVVDQRLLY